MRATGIIRRVDDLGRVVIPKELRRTLGIREGDPLEIFALDTGGVGFFPYRTSLASEVKSLKNRLEEALDCSDVKIDKIGALLDEVFSMVNKAEEEM